jgi:two-component system alkaline phosphatase synthesis response regulator PhoP
MPHKILIADDEPNIVISLDFLMRREGYAVHIARDGQEAIEAIEQHRPALVLLDVMMPRKTGFEVCETVRARSELDSTLILMLTAKGRETDIAKGLALGANAYMTKPFSTQELTRKVAEMLQGAA